MRYLFNHWKSVEKAIRESRRVLLLTDYDGTLTPIVSSPEKAILDKRQREALKALSKNKRYSVGVISGRKLSDVKNFVRLNNIYYAGNHGLEIEGPGISFLHPSCRRFKKDLKRINERLAPAVRGIEGAIVEHKGVSVSLHYRMVRRKDIKALKSAFDAICAPYLKRGRIKLSSGKKIWEIKLPIKWHKGDAVGRIWGILKKSCRDILPVYLGDDATDEDAFLFLKGKKAITVFVGKSGTATAGYYVRSPFDVRRLLIRLCRI